MMSLLMAERMMAPTFVDLFVALSTLCAVTSDIYGLRYAESLFVYASRTHERVYGVTMMPVCLRHDNIYDMVRDDRVRV